ncbi:MAG TPA: hypothetical protein VGL42_15740 [Opitutaceae bacterium]|jgi:hypothetical protein
MDEFEHYLRKRHLAVPSVRLDRRIESTLAAPPAQMQPAASFSSALARWSLGAGMGIAAGVALLLMSPRKAENEEPIVYRIEASSQLRKLLISPRSRTASQPLPFVVRSQNP